MRGELGMLGMPKPAVSHAKRKSCPNLGLGSDFVPKVEIQAPCPT